MRLGITAIWYPEKQYDKVDEILRLAKSEMCFTKSQVARGRHFAPPASKVRPPMADPAAP